MRKIKTYRQTLLLLAANGAFLRFRFSNTYKYVPLPVLEKRRFRCALASLLACFCFVLPSPVQAARFSGDYLLQMCGYDEKGKEIVKGGHIACQAYIAGILDYHNLIRSLGTAPSVDFCVPDDVTMNEVHQKITSYVFRNKHEQGPFIAAPGVALGLFQAYPCKK